MKIKNLHIIFSLLILGVVSLISVGMNSSPNPSFFIETEIEESINDISELDFEKDFSHSSSDDGGKAAFLNTDIFINAISYYAIVFQNTYKKERSQKVHLFILYCCLKLDC